jgi:uncharacterized membrane protein
MPADPNLLIGVPLFALLDDAERAALAAFQGPVIMMSQNRQAAKDRLAADLDYQVNLKAELQVSHMHRRMDRIYELLQERLAPDAARRGPGGAR